MFLLRTVFWLAIVVMILPTNPNDQRKILGFMQTAVSDVAGFCERNPEACTDGQRAFGQLKDKAEFGVTLVLDAFATKTSGPETLRQPVNHSTWSPSAWFSSKPSAKPENRISAPQGENTLRKDDLQPYWNLEGA